MIFIALVDLLRSLEPKDIAIKSLQWQNWECKRKFHLFWGRFQKCPLYLNFHLSEIVTLPLRMSFSLQKTSWIASLNIAYLNDYPQIHDTILLFSFILFWMMWKCACILIKGAEKRNLECKNERQSKHTETMEGKFLFLYWLNPNIFIVNNLSSLK